MFDEIQECDTQLVFGNDSCFVLSYHAQYNTLHAEGKKKLHLSDILVIFGV